ncbi:hypothetical protein HDR59_04185 [bacterium]|nr:hypothetical protein [bacterium]
MTNEKLLNEIKEQNQQILLLLQLLVASSDEIKMNYGKIQSQYNEKRTFSNGYVSINRDEVILPEKFDKTYKEYYKDRIKDIYKNDAIPMNIIKELLNTKQK